MAAIASRVQVGDPRDSTTTTVGPMVSRRDLEWIRASLRLGVAEGKRLLVGGEAPDNGFDGYFTEASAFTGVTNDMRIAREEILVLVLSIFTHQTEEEALAIAIDTPMGCQHVPSMIRPARR